MTQTQYDDYFVIGITITAYFHEHVIHTSTTRWYQSISNSMNNNLQCLFSPFDYIHNMKGMKLISVISPEWVKGD